MLLMLNLLLSASASPAADSREAVYRTSKSMTEIETCLTQGLSKRGDISSISAEGYVTLTLHDASGRIMVIDISPPTVVVRTKFAYRSREIVKSCL